jgi:hypothetical protein
MRNRHPSQTVERALLPRYEWPRKGHTAGSPGHPVQLVIDALAYRVTSSTFCHYALLCVYTFVVSVGVEMLSGPP